MVAAEDVGELVREERVELLEVQVGQKARGQQQPRSATVRPEHGRDAGRDEEDRRHAAQSQPGGEGGRALRNRVGRGPRAGEQAGETAEPPGREQRDGQRPGREE